MYLAEEAWRRRGVSANIHYRSALAVLFGVKKYADALWDVVNQGWCMNNVTNKAICC